MEFPADLLTLLKMGAKLAQHKTQQYRLATNETQVRTTSDGKVKGIKRKTIYDECYYAFEGIPYAKPPLGELRFRAPQPAATWEGIRDCTNCRSKPLQKHMMLPIIEGSEDCLYLNVYAKKLESEAPLPVIAWIHGGGFQIGEASRDVYAPDYFMLHDVVLVTITYRLGALGFLSLNDPDLGVPGNAGIKDQIMALRWVKNNISNFNGDCNNITLIGESAGAASTHILMCSPQANGLFHKAIMMSGAGLCPWAVAPQRDWAFRLACNLGYNGPNNDKQIFRFLSNIEGRKIITACNRLINKQEKREHIIVAFTPTVEPYESEFSVITKHFRELLPKAWSNDIPLILGCTSFEGLFCYQMPKKDPYIINELGDCEVMVPWDARIGKSEPEIRDMGLKLKQLYFNNETPTVEEHFYQYLDMTSYHLMWHGVYRTLLARLSYAKAVPTYLYRFDFDSPDFNHYRYLKCGSAQRGVSHADDLSYMFYNIAATTLPKTSPEYVTIERLTSMWSSFAKSSSPNCAKITPTVWEPVHSSEPSDIKCLNISDRLQVINLPEQINFETWNSFYNKETLF